MYAWGVLTKVRTANQESHAFRLGSASNEQDFDLWRVKHIECLQRGQWNELDLEHLIEELDAMGRSGQRELLSRLALLLAHLLKWTWPPKQRKFLTKIFGAICDALIEKISLHAE